MNENDTNNATESDFISSIEESANLSTWILTIYFGNVIIGAIFNISSFLALLRSKRNGTLSIIFQLSGIDVLSTCVCVIEIWTIKSNRWSLPNELCPIYAGTEVLTNTLILYLIIALNFHTISLSNLKLSERETRNRNPLTSCDASNECLVRDSRNITIDYRNKRRKLSIIFPSILVWCIALSISIPQYTLTTTLKNYDDNTTFCAFIDVHFGRLMQSCLVSFRVFIPSFLILISTIILIYKLYEHSRNNSIENIFEKKSHNTIYYLTFCLILNVVYLITSLQRLIIYSIHSFAVTTNSIYKFPSVYTNYSTFTLPILLSMLHYSGIFFRFLIYLFLLPKFKSLICNKVLMCFNNKN